jgi:hypothetical protein
MDKDKALDLALEALEEPGLLWRSKKAITAIKQARALDKKAENARELGLDYEPVPENFIDALKFDVAMRDAAPVQELDHSDELTIAYLSGVHRGKELAVAQAVPDAIIEAGESPEFRDGWNECRETMLQMLKARKA